MGPLEEPLPGSGSPPCHTVLHNSRKEQNLCYLWWLPAPALTLLLSLTSHVQARWRSWRRRRTRPPASSSPSPPSPPPPPPSTARHVPPLIRARGSPSVSPCPPLYLSFCLFVTVSSSLPPHAPTQLSMSRKRSHPSRPAPIRPGLLRVAQNRVGVRVAQYPKASQAESLRVAPSRSESL